MYREQHEGRNRNMAICVPFVLGVPYPDWATRDIIFGCENYVPESMAHFYHLKDMGFLYNRDKPMVEITIGLGTVVTALGVPGKCSVNLGLMLYSHCMGTESGVVQRPNGKFSTMYTDLR